MINNYWGIAIYIEWYPEDFTLILFLLLLDRTLIFIKAFFAFFLLQLLIWSCLSYLTVLAENEIPPFRKPSRQTENLTLEAPLHQTGWDWSCRGGWIPIGHGLTNSPPPTATTQWWSMKDAPDTLEGIWEFSLFLKALGNTTAALWCLQANELPQGNQSQLWCHRHVVKEQNSLELGLTYGNENSVSNNIQIYWRGLGIWGVTLIYFL